jgi:hypothetical protein
MLRVAPRSAPVRCAFCHDDADPSARTCERCGTLLHGDCWELARLCPSLGCAPRLRQALVRLVPRVEGASRELFVSWLLATAIVWATLVFVWPSFDRMYSETGICLPDLTAAVVALSRFATSLPGTIVAAHALPASVAAYRRWRHRAALRRFLVACLWLEVAYVPIAFFAAFTPLCQITQKL